MQYTRSRGFTLIELLVVIAIIGILSAVVLASLGTARTRGVTAAVQSSMDGSRAQAELFAAGNSNSYSNLCTTAGTSNGLQDILKNAAQPTGATVSTGAAGGAGKVVCNSTQNAWAAEAQLSSAGSPNFFCVDSNGSATTSATSLISGSTDYAC